MDHLLTVSVHGREQTANSQCPQQLAPWSLAGQRLAGRRVHVVIDLLCAAGVAYYHGWKTATVSNVDPNTNWVVMCGQNGGSNLKLVNGRSVGTSGGGSGG